MLPSFGTSLTDIFRSEIHFDTSTGVMHYFFLIPSKSERPPREFKSDKKGRERR